MGAAMLLVTVPALALTRGSLRIPAHSFPLGSPVAVLMALGSILYAVALSCLPAGPTLAIATSYVLIVVALSVAFLHEPFDWIVGLGLVMMIGGVVLLSFRA